MIADADGVERPVLLRRRHHRAPRARRPRVAERHLRHAALPGVRLLLGAGDGEREVLEGPQPDAVAGRDPAVEAVAAVLDLLGRQGEPLALERPVDDRRHPPAGDRVLAELEQALAHVPSPIRIRPARRRRAARGPRVRRPDRPPAAGPRPAPHPGGGRGQARTPPRLGRRRPWTGRRSDRPCSAAIDVETRPGMPHGSMRSKSARSTPTFRAMPWYATPRSTRIPRAPILRGAAPSGSTQQPGCPSRRPASTPKARHVSASAASRARTYGRRRRPRSARRRIG